MKKTEETETPDLTEETKPKPKLIQCYGHFTDSDGRAATVPSAAAGREAARSGTPTMRPATDIKETGVNDG